MQLKTIQAVARYWTDEYDWRRCEARLNALPQFKTEIDGEDVHFIGEDSKRLADRSLSLRHKRMTLNGAATDPTLAAEVWAISEKQTGIEPAR